MFKYLSQITDLILKVLLFPRGNSTVGIIFNYVSLLLSFSYSTSLLKLLHMILADFILKMCAICRRHRCINWLCRCGFEWSLGHEKLSCDSVTTWQECLMLFSRNSKEFLWHFEILSFDETHRRPNSSPIGAVAVATFWYKLLLYKMECICYMNHVFSLFAFFKRKQ